jgi:adenosylhomocysteinase
MDTLDEARSNSFFRAVVEDYPAKRRLKSVLITHLLADRPFQIEAIDNQAKIAAIVPKAKSIHQPTRHWLARKYNVRSVLREEFDKADFVLEFLSSVGDGQPLVLLDIGGYFSRTIESVVHSYKGGIAGIIEDTENGIQKYEKLAHLPCPIVSVARSPLKAPEDYLVGQSIVFSTEALLRAQGDILHGRTACVIGYGKLGRSIANLLHARHVQTVIYDVEAIRAVEAMSHGFAVGESLTHSLRGAGLVFCATGNVSLSAKDFDQLDNGAYIATVTSSDDELALDEIRHDYELKQVTDYITRYRKGSRHFYILNRGQAVNFIHGAAVGPFIYLVQAEIVASISRVADGSLDPGIIENSEPFRAKIARRWLEAFKPTAT